MKKIFKTIFTCDKCGKNIEYNPSDEWDYTQEECWSFNMGRPGYGSGLDGCDVEFDLCDDCLIELVNSFTWEGKARVFNSGSNMYGSDEDWIKSQKDIESETKSVSDDIQRMYE